MNKNNKVSLYDPDARKFFMELLQAICEFGLIYSTLYRLNIGSKDDFYVKLEEDLGCKEAIAHMLQTKRSDETKSGPINALFGNKIEIKAD